jgi:outer membrane protein OmpA-like peptidoglycan-associated protein
MSGFNMRINNLILTVSVLAPISAGAQSTLPHLGATIGFQTLSTDIGGEIPKSGFEANFFGGAIHQLKEFEFEGDLGFRYSKLSGESAGVTKKITFFMAEAQLIPRYRLTPEFSLGPTFNLWFGTDTTHTEQPDAGAAMVWTTGLSARYQVPESPLSVVAHVTTDLNLADQRLLTFGAGVLYHFGMGAKSDDEPEPEPLVAELPVEEPPLESIEGPGGQVEVAKNYIILRIPEDVLLFDTGMSHLKAKQKEYVKHLGEVLVKFNERWTSIGVTGHTDYRGSDQLNMELSTGRAKSVFDMLVESGVDNTRIQSEGKGESEPLTQETDATSLARNRRTEIKIDGIEAGSDLAQELVSITP